MGLNVFKALGEVGRCVSRGDDGEKPGRVFLDSPARGPKGLKTPFPICNYLIVTI
jgi:hypothetical protein